MKKCWGRLIRCRTARTLLAVVLFVSTAGALVDCAPASPVEVSPVTGRPLDEAAAILRRAGLRVGQIRREYTGGVPQDQVVAQNPPAGATVERNTTEYPGIARCGGSTAERTILGYSLRHRSAP